MAYLGVERGEALLNRSKAVRFAAVVTQEARQVCKDRVRETDHPVAGHARHVAEDDGEHLHGRCQRCGLEVRVRDDALLFQQEAGVVVRAVHLVIFYCHY